MRLRNRIFALKNKIGSFSRKESSKMLAKILALILASQTISPAMMETMLTEKINEVAPSIEQVVDKVKDGVSYAFEEGKEWFQDGIEKTGDNLKTTYDWAINAFEDSKEYVEDKAEDISKNFNNFIDWTKDTYEHVVTSITKSNEEVVNEYIVLEDGSIEVKEVVDDNVQELPLPEVTLAPEFDANQYMVFNNGEFGSSSSSIPIPTKEPVLPNEEVVNEYIVLDDGEIVVQDISSSEANNIDSLDLKDNQVKSALNTKVIKANQYDDRVEVQLSNGQRYNVPYQYAYTNPIKTRSGNIHTIERIGCSICAAYAMVSYFTDDVEIDIYQIFKEMGRNVQYSGIERLFRNNEIKINDNTVISFDGSYSGAEYVGRNTNPAELWKTCREAWDQGKAVVFTVAKSNDTQLKKEYGLSSNQMNERTGINSRSGHYIVIFGSQGNTPDSELIFADSTGEGDKAFDKNLTFYEFYNYYIKSACGKDGRYAKKYEIFDMNNITYKEASTMAKTK